MPSWPPSSARLWGSCSSRQPWRTLSARAVLRRLCPARCASATPLAHVLPCCRTLSRLPHPGRGPVQRDREPEQRVQVACARVCGRAAVVFCQCYPSRVVPLIFSRQEENLILARASESLISPRQQPCEHCYVPAAHGVPNSTNVDSSNFTARALPSSLASPASCCFSRPGRVDGVINGRRTQGAPPERALWLLCAPACCSSPSLGLIAAR